MKDKMNFSEKIIQRLNWLEVKPKLIRLAIQEYRRYAKDYQRFSEKERWEIVKYPCLFDRYQDAGNFGEYFFQDLYVAKRIIELNPCRHIDVGSRIDGFVAHLACNRKLEVLDIRPVRAEIEGVNFRQVDITKLGCEWHGVADCVSCLHALEHFGLGRYGDDLDPDGWMTGLVGLQKILTDGGVLWLSVPVGLQRVEFNAHRVFNPWTIHDFALSLGLVMEEFAFLDENKMTASSDFHGDYDRLSRLNYTLGLFKFAKR